MDIFTLQHDGSVYRLSHRVGYTNEIVGAYATRDEARSAMFAIGGYSHDDYPSVRSVDDTEVFTFARHCATL
ncbi:MAG: hypothetical protein ACYCTG_06585 [Ferrimicrobium sp.]